MVDLKELANQLVNLTVKEVNELAQILKEEHKEEIIITAAELKERVRQRKELKKLKGL